MNSRRKTAFEYGNSGNLIAGGVPILVNNKLPLTFMITNAESMNKSFTVKINIISFFYILAHYEYVVGLLA